VSYGELERLFEQFFALMFTFLRAWSDGSPSECCPERGARVISRTSHSPRKTYRKPIEIHGTAATIRVPISKATMYATIGPMPSSGCIRLMAQAA
jgi:lipoprotein-anchoring transpeptidase ErfK/SrfK